jgi:hypothetical protein
MIPYSLANFLCLYWGALALAQPGPMRVTLRAVAGAASFFCFMLLMRVYDELKDVASDLRLGRAGDPKYQSRPIVTGQILESDLRRLRWVVTAVLVALNLPFARSAQGIAFAGVFALAWLSFRWFFWPTISRHLLLAFITHNPLGLALGAYAISVAIADFGLAPPSGALALLVAFWLPLAAWETSRKIRVPADETDYETYSKTLGRSAPLFPAGFVATSAGLLVWLGQVLGLGWIYTSAIALAAAVAVCACLLFLFAPTRGRARLQPYAELFGLVATVALPLALALLRGVRIG